MGHIHTASTPPSRTILQVFTETGALNEHGEFRWWLHVWRKGEKEVTSNIYPWPFAIEKTVRAPVIDFEVLIAHMYVTKMKNWPGGWPVFGFSTNRVKYDDNYCKLAPGIGKHLTYDDRYPTYRIPEAFIHALVRSG